MHEKHNAAPASARTSRRCSQCGSSKPVTEFYTNPATICKDCHNRASRFTNACRRAAIAHLIATYGAEYRTLLRTERERRAGSDPASGGGSDAA